MQDKSLLHEFEQCYIDNGIEEKIQILKQHYKSNNLEGYHNELTNLLSNELSNFLIDKQVNIYIIKLILNIGKSII